MNISVRAKSSEPNRCPWVTQDPLYIHYHDFEWGIPIFEDKKLFEMLILESFQAGLSWLTILRKRGNFTQAFEDWNPERVARFNSMDIKRLMSDAGIVRNILKIKASVQNANAFLSIQENFGSFSHYIWRFTGGKPVIQKPRPVSLATIPVRTEISDDMSRDLKQRGFTFVGTKICYAFMQACGLADDHVQSCFRAQ
ncbi:DNA-3-methyladenine glycosylase I [bacterium]|nr:DNA-3-methyladenine glycosylase I [candidate division CSSED10-310 bacterium]